MLVGIHMINSNLNHNHPIILLLSRVIFTFWQLIGDDWLWQELFHFMWNHGVKCLTLDKILVMRLMGWLLILHFFFFFGTSIHVSKNENIDFHSHTNRHMKHFVCLWPWDWQNSHLAKFSLNIYSNGKRFASLKKIYYSECMHIFVFVNIFAYFATKIAKVSW